MTVAKEQPDIGSPIESFGSNTGFRLLEKSVNTWEKENPDYELKHLDQSVIVERENEGAPDLSLNFLDFLIGSIKQNLGPEKLPQTIKKITINWGGDEISIHPEDADGNGTQFYCEPTPPFNICNAERDEYLQ